MDDLPKVIGEVQFHDIRVDKLVWCNCKSCNPESKSSKGEEKIKQFLINNNIVYVREKRFDDLKSDLNMQLPFDFYLPNYNILIEFDGEQHYRGVKMFGGDNVMNRIKINDGIKNQYVLNSNMYLIRIPYTKIVDIDILLSSYINDVNREKLKIIMPKKYTR